jgi:hypothetical protein
VRWMLVLRVALSGPLRCCHRPVSRRCVPGPSLPDPPRCCVGLRCLTTRRSRSFGFSAPPTSLASRSGPWRLPSGRRSCCCQKGRDTTHDLARTLEDLVRAPVWSSGATSDGRPFVPDLLP